MSTFNNNAYKHTLNTADHFSGLGSGSFLSKWLGGIAVPIVITIYAVNCIITKQAVMAGVHGSQIELTRTPAVAFGVAWLCVAIFLHFHYFWPTLKRLWVLTDVGKTIAALGFIVSLGYVLWSIFRSWI